MKLTAYRTRQNNEDLYWSNEDGWVDLQAASLFTISESNTLSPPSGSVAVDNIRMEGTKRIVDSIRTEFPPSEAQKSALIEKLREMDIKAYDEQRELCAKVLEEQACIQCYDKETLGELIEAVAANINDGTLDCDCFELATA